MQLGECPRWNKHEARWYWVDILNSQLYRAPKNGLPLQQRTLPFMPGCFFFTEQNQILLTSNNGIYLLPSFSAEPVCLIESNQLPQGQRFNDGTATPDGRFIAGTLLNGVSKTGVSFSGCFTNPKSLHLKELTERYTIINGQCFSPDGNRYYVADSPRCAVWQFDYDKISGALSNKQLFYQFESELEFPDGAATDVNGNYWVALYGTGKIAVISPQGNRLKDIQLPVSQPTMVAFGGSHGDELLITSAAQSLNNAQLEQQPLAGSVFLLKTNTKGTTQTLLRHPTN